MALNPSKEGLVYGLDRLSRALSGSLCVLGAVGLGGLAGLILIDVVGRQVGSPVRGTVEIIKASIPAVVFLVIPYTMYTGGHVRSTVILDRVPKRVRSALEFISVVAGILFFAVIAFGSWSRTWRAFATGEYQGEGALRVPTFPTRATVLIASIVMVIVCVNALVQLIARREESEDRMVEVTQDLRY